MWTYRGTFGVTEVDLNGNAGPGYDKLKSFKFGGINAAYGASIFSLWLTSDGNGSRFQLIASMDAGYEQSDKMRYNYMLSNDVRAQTHLGDFPWYLNMQIDIRNDNLAIYYLNKKQTLTYEYRQEKHELKPIHTKHLSMLVVMGA